MTELEEALLALRVAENHFNEAATPNQVDMAIFEYNEALDRYEKALRKAKAERLRERRDIPHRGWNNDRSKDR